MPTLKYGEKKKQEENAFIHIIALLAWDWEGMLSGKRKKCSRKGKGSGREKEKNKQKQWWMEGLQPWTFWSVVYFECQTCTTSTLQPGLYSCSHEF